MILTACAIFWVVMAVVFGGLSLAATIYAACTGGVPHPRMGWLLTWAWERQPRHKAPGPIRIVINYLRGPS